MDDLHFPTPLKDALNETISHYSEKKYLDTDPIFFPSQYSNPLDIEIVGLIACLYAYGNVKAIRGFLSPLFESLGSNPYLALYSQNEYYVQTLNNSKLYRFQTKADNQKLIEALSLIVREHKKSRVQEPIFEPSFLNSEGIFNAISGISNFQIILETKVMEVFKSNKLTRGLRFLIGDPKAKSAKKRICLFLRWMVRNSFPDFGIYKNILANQIPFPLDVHIQRLIKVLGISSRRTFGLKDAISIKNYFQRINHKDPLLYDFYLTRVGMIQKCRGEKVEEICSGCKLRPACVIGSATGN